MRAFKLYTCIVFGLLIFNSISCSQGTEPKIPVSPLSIGESVQLYSEILSEERVINIYLPNGFSPDSSKNYPVIYLLDGAIDEDFIHVSGIVQFGSFPWINMIPESIVVGIANVDRERDFTWPISNEEERENFPSSGKSDAFVSFIERELKPWVSERYPTKGPTTLIGQSLGGLLAADILFKKPDMFDNYIIVSPSLWWDGESLLDQQPATYSSSKSIYIAVGKEGEVMERTARELYDKLSEINAPNTRLWFDFKEKFDHGDILHQAVYDAFEKVNK